MMRQAQDDSQSDGEIANNAELLDLDDEQGVEVCKTYLCSLEMLMSSLEISLCSREYRKEFSNSYKALYTQMEEQYGSFAAYLPEILDSAQESFDHLWVNGEKYVFSEHVVESGTELFEHFNKLRHFSSDFYRRNFETQKRTAASGLFTPAAEVQKMKDMLARFDELWTIYENKYVSELMIIENDARRFVIESINAETELLQKEAHCAPLEEQDESKRSLLYNAGQVNAVANVEGKGRDDFDLRLLQKSE